MCVCVCVRVRVRVRACERACVCEIAIIIQLSSLYDVNKCRHTQLKKYFTRLAKCINILDRCIYASFTSANSTKY